MAKVQSGDQGIKLFGTTITLHGIRERKEEEKGGDCELDGTETERETEREVKKRNRIIACPRCKSMETKFCYFNNYNVNQPRHFCKGCQRYWTAGGALRNVPVGAGRRKAKPPCTATDGTGFYHAASTVQQFGLDEEWHVAATMVPRDFHQLFPYSKRRRMSSDGQPC